MTNRSDRDVRYFPDVVDQIVTPWRHAEAGELRGRVVVVSGPPYAGRSTVLGQVADDLHHAGVRVVRRRAQAGTLHAPDDSGPAQYGIQGAKVVAAALQVAGAGAVGDLVALAAEIGSTRLLADALDPAHLPSDPYVAVGRVEEAVRRQAQEGRLALIVDDADKLDTPEVWWDVLFGTTLPRLADHLPLLVVLAVERSSTVASYALEVLDKRLAPGARVEEIRLPPLDAARIEAALGPVDHALLRQLRPLVQGRPGWLDEVWRTWRAEGAVVQRDGRWVAAPDARDRVGLSLHAWVERLVRAGVPDGDAYWRAKKIIETAALEGQRFTVEALATVLGDDVEELIDWIDDHLADAEGESLLEEDGFVERADGVEPPELRCYRFGSSMVAGVLRQEVLAGTNGKELARRYAHAMASAYRWSPVSASAWTISRLATAAGDEDLAEYTWRRANRLEGVEAAARLGRFLVDHLDTDGASAAELAAMVERLNDVTGELLAQWEVGETLELCRVAERSARAVAAAGPSKVPTDRATGLLVHALQRLGEAAFSAGALSDAATALGEAVALSVATVDHLRTADLLRLLANVEELDTRESRNELRAREHAAAALEHARRVASREALLTQVWCLHQIARLADDAEERTRRNQALLEAAVLLAGPNFRGSLTSLGSAIHTGLQVAGRLAVSDKRPLDGERFYAAVTRCRTHTEAYVIALLNLSAVQARIGKKTDAMLTAVQGLRLAQGHSTEREGVALLQLADYGQSFDVPSAGTLAVLAHARIRHSVLVSHLLPHLNQNFGADLAEIGDVTRQQIERNYRADRGASLLRETFGVDVAEIDALNERLGDATEDELRGFLLEIQQYCAREAAT